MGSRENYLAWLHGSFLNEAEKKELQAMREEEIQDRFYRDLAFGTAGLRGIRGLGTNRMNIHVVRKVTQGYAAFLLEAFPERRENGVYLVYDCRHGSRLFAQEAARVFSANGIPAHVFADYRSTPQLSWVIRERKAMGGLVLTASHNPSDYNGYKAYNASGCQLSPEEADAVFGKVDAIESFDQVLVDETGRLVTDADPALDTGFLDAVASLHRGPANPDLRILYTPLHGVGGAFTRSALADLGYQVDVVAAQFEPDGDFPTAPKPNPEEAEALELLLEQGRRTQADLLLATDPDADRLGVVARHKGDYTILSGNQMGALLVDHLIRHRTIERPCHLVKSVVTSDFAADIAERNGLHVENTLTGFKFIGARVGEFAARGEQVLFAFEESIGYLPGAYIRDKDGIGTAVVVAEMAGTLHREGKTLVDRLDELYAEYGYYAEDTLNVFLEGRSGREQMKAFMASLRTDPFVLATELAVVERKDFLEDHEGFAKSDVLHYRLANGSWFAIRPSGTEPKLKAYISCRAPGRSDAERDLQTIREAITARLERFLTA